MPVRPDASKVFCASGVTVSNTFAPMACDKRMGSGNDCWTCPAQVVATNRGVVYTPYRPPGRTAELYGALRGITAGTGKSTLCARTGDPAIVVARERVTAMGVRRIP